MQGMGLYPAPPSWVPGGGQKCAKFFCLHHSAKLFVQELVVGLGGGGDTPQMLRSVGWSEMFQPGERRCGVGKVPGGKGAMGTAGLVVLGVFSPLLLVLVCTFLRRRVFSSAPALCLRMRLPDFMLVLV